MDNYLCMQRSKEIEELSRQLGFENSFFLDKFVIIREKNVKDIIHKVREAKQKKLQAVCRVSDEKQLRYVLERVPVNMVLGQESIFVRDSVHYVKSGLDQTLCTIAALQKKTIVFSMHDLLHAKDRPVLVARIRFNIRLCKKYGVSFFLCNFSAQPYEMRSAKDLKAILGVLGA